MTKLRQQKCPRTKWLQIFWAGYPHACRLRVGLFSMRRDEIINLKMAVHVTGRSEKTIRNWCKEFGIGVQPCPGAPLEISMPALEMVRHGDVAALELLREGKRDHPRVRRVFEHLGLP